MKNPWKKISRRIVYKNPWITIPEDKVIMPSGRKGIYAYVDRCGSVVIVPVTDKREVYLVRQWRYPMGKQTIELPWGGTERHETSLKAAKRELAEETGLQAKKWNYLGAIDVLGSYGNEIAYIFLARRLTTGKNEPDDTELISLFKVPFIQAFNWCIKGKIANAPCIAALVRTKYYLGI